MIRINDDYVITVDSLEYTVCEDKHRKTVDKDGNEKDVYIPIGHFMHLEAALNFLRDYLVKKSLASSEYTLEQAIKEIARFNNEFVTTFNKAMYGE